MRQLMHSFIGHTPPTEILAAVQRGEIASFCLFRHQNVKSPAQVRELNEQLYRAAREGGQLPPIIGIDQEGGQLVAISEGATELPGNMALGATRSPELAEKAGRVLGLELLAMGVNLDFAPSLDVNVNPFNPVIGIRSFGDDPVLVSELGTALIDGLQAVDVIASAKHVPGHGDVGGDSHYLLPLVDHSMERMLAVELYPFIAAIKNGVKSIMTAHVLVPILDNENAATLSPAILNDFLRRELGFQGLILTDAMDMYAVAQLGHETSVRLAIEAGADLVLLAHLPDQLALNDKLRGVARPDSLARIAKVQSQIPTQLPSLDVVGCAEHWQIAQEIADKSITMVRQGRQLPLQPAPDDLIVVITPEPVDLTPADTSSSVRIMLADAIEKRHRRVKALQLPNNATSAQIRDILNAAEQADIVVVGTISAERDDSQINLVQGLYDQGNRPIVVAMRTPYDVMSFPLIETYLCSYGIRPVTTEAIARVLFGEIEAQGVLPCAIPGVFEPQ
jgi:beta-N-acetylhexosaminidase